MGNIANITGGYAFKSDTLNSIGGKYQVVKMGNLYQNQLDLHRSPSYTDTLTRKAENVILRKDDIAITLTGTNNKKDFGYTYIFNDEKNLLLCASSSSPSSRQTIMYCLPKTARKAW